MENGNNAQEVWEGRTNNSEPWLLNRDLCYCISGWWLSHDISEPEDARGIKEKSVKSECVKKSSRVTKCGSSFEKLLAATANLPRDTKTSEDPRNPLFKVLLSLFTNTIKDAFYHLHEKTSDFYALKKWTVGADILMKWGWSIVGSGTCVLWKYIVPWHFGEQRGLNINIAVIICNYYRKLIKFSD